MKIRLEQLNPVVGDSGGNSKKILQALQKAESNHIDLLILPEMAVTGYPAQDLLEKEAFRNICYKINNEIIHSTGKTAILFGSLTPNKTGKGRKMFNSAILARNQDVLGVTHKTLLPTYDVFDDFRYFEPNNKFECLSLDDFKLGVTICEDIWYNENEVQYHFYDINPAALLKEKGADVIINISASPFTKTKHENRVGMLRNHAKKLNLPVLYVNQVGAQTDIVFDGDSMALDRNGEIKGYTTAFEEGFTDVNLDKMNKNLETIFVKKNQTYPDRTEERLYKAVLLGLNDYLKKTSVTNKVVIGLSGGIDSALTTVLAAEALGQENVTAITLPSLFSSKGSVSDSEKLAINLDIKLHKIEIKEIYNSFERSLASLFEGTDFGVAEENLQSRIRGDILMAYSNKFGDFLLATGNKSEYAVGYATLYGDMNGALAPIGDIYKSEVFSLACWLNDLYYEEEMIPENIIKKPPSAELRPEQKDTDSLPEYEILDDILYRYIELQQSSKKISEFHKSVTVQDVIGLVDRNEFKRYQAAPILKLTSKAFGTGRRWPIVQKWTGHEF
ncbi:MAG: NAD+ synthase [Balneolaceae bacterium]